MFVQLPRFGGLLLAALVTACTIRYAAFVPWGTDAGSYVSAARQWANADVFSPEHFQLWAPWPEIGVPLGSRHGAIRGTHVSMYPLGLPVFLAVGDRIDPELGPYVIPPLFAGVLVWATFLIASRVANDWAALLAALLMALSPIALGHAMMVMSDVPATALVMLSMAMSIRGTAMSAAAAGASLAGAVMIRPILAPIGVVPFALILAAAAPTVFAWRRWNWKNAFAFLLLALVGPVMVLWSQAILYGGALTPGYVEWETFFSRERICENLGVYPRNVMAIHSPFVFLGLVTAIPLYFAIGRKDSLALRTIVGLIVLVLMNYALYLPYLTYDDVWFMRFVLPAQAALFVLLAVAVAYAVIAVARLSKPLAIVCVIPALIVMNQGRALFPQAVGTHTQQAHLRLMGRYLREVLPRNAAVISFVHSGAVVHYTGGPIVRFDFVAAAWIDDVLKTLVRRGYRPVFLLDQENDAGLFKEHFTGTNYERLDWPARAKFVGAGTLWYLDFADRDGALERPIDVLR